MSDTYEPPNPYAPTLLALAAEDAIRTRSPEAAFADEHTKKRMRELKAEHAEAELRTAEAPFSPRLTAAELAQYVPPNPWTVK